MSRRRIRIRQSIPRRGARLVLALVVATLSGSVFALAANMNVTSDRLTTHVHTVAATPTPTATPCAVSFVDEEGNSGNTKVLTISRPSDVQIGDLLVAHVLRAGPVRSMTPSGWVLIRADANGTTIGQHLYYRKILTQANADVSSYSWDVGDANTNASGAILAYRGIDLTGSPLNGAAPTPLMNTTNSTTYLAPAITPAVNSGPRFAVFGTNANTSISAPDGMTTRSNLKRTSASSSASDQNLGTTGATEQKSSAGNGSGLYIGHSLALLPKSSPC